jgi:nucleoside-diphosphate-sugar epimerase
MTRILLAGATGVLGRPLTERLRESGHEVFGIYRSHASADALRALGCTPVAVDVFDERAVAKTFQDVRPEVVLHQITALARDPTSRAMAASVRATSDLRRRTVPLFARLSQEAGARFIAQSISFVTKPEGPDVQDESAPLWLDGPRVVADTVDAVRVLEEATVAAGGIALRYGFFYGPGTWYARDGAIVNMIRDRRLPLTGSGGGFASFVHVDDAVQATMSAMTRGERGVYNVCDDEPVRQRDWLPELARMLGAKPPRRAPSWLVRAVAGAAAVYYANTLRGASNAKAKKELRFTARAWRTAFATELAASEPRA